MSMDKHAPWKPASYENRDIGALKNLMLGEASPEQQTRAVKFIIETVCKTYDLSYRPDSQRDTDFAEGKRFVGLQLVKLINYDPTKMRNDDVGPDSRSSRER